MQCRNCKLKSLKRVVKIGDQPISSLFYKKKKYKLKKYPAIRFYNEQTV